MESRSGRPVLAVALEVSEGKENVELGDGVDGVGAATGSNFAKSLSSSEVFPFGQGWE